MRKNLPNILGLTCSLAVGLFLVVLAIWQLDLIMVHPIWNSLGWSINVQYASLPWQCWFWNSTVGAAYNTLLALIVAGFFITFFGTFISIWTWPND